MPQRALGASSGKGTKHLQLLLNWLKHIYDIILYLCGIKLKGLSWPATAQKILMNPISGLSAAVGYG